jgi:hypothetical protein
MRSRVSSQAMPSYGEWIALADFDLSLVAGNRLIWHDFGDDARDDPVVVVDTLADSAGSLLGDILEVHPNIGPQIERAP